MFKEPRYAIIAQEARDNDLGLLQANNYVIIYENDSLVILLNNRDSKTP